jgi:translocation and assembly module TamB
MSRTGRVIRNTGIGLGVLVVVVLVGAVTVVHTGWFRNFVKQQIISATEEATGARVEIGSFNFAVSDLRATITDFVIHGNEPPGSPPFVRVGRLQADIRPLFDIAFLGVDRPEANIILLADGRTNVPTPRRKSTSNKPALETVVDLAIGRFELTNGLLTLQSRKQPLNVRGNNLRAQVAYDRAAQGYQGQLALEPLYVVSGRNTPVSFKFTLPFALRRDRIDVRNASIQTAASAISINASLENLQNPKASAHISGRIATIDLANAGNLPLAVNAKNVPSQIDFDASATVANNVIEVAGLRANLGKSNVGVSGRNGSLAFQAQFAVGEIGRLLKNTPPDGIVGLNGNVRIGQRIINVNGLRLTAFGGELDGDASLEDFDRYKVSARLRSFDIQTALRSFGVKAPYEGALSGPIDAQGSLNAPGTTSVVAQAQMEIAPGRRGIPVSGRLNANYNGAADDFSIGNSFVALPHTRLTLDGSVGKQLNIALTTRDIRDLVAGQQPIVFNGGEAAFRGTVTGKMSSPRIDGHLAANRFSVEGRQFDSLAADVAASSGNAAIRNGDLRRGMMQAQFAAAAGLRNWKAPPRTPVSADLSVRNGDLADVIVLAGKPAAGYAGALSASAHVGGTIGNPQGTATVEVLAGTIEAEPFDRASIQVNLADQLVTVPAASIQGSAGRMDLTAEYQHPRDSFNTGHVHAHLQSSPVDLGQIRKVSAEQPDASGVVQLNVDMQGNLEQTGFLLTVANADVSARGVKFEGQNYGDLTASARTTGQTIAYNLNSDFAGANIRVNGNTQLLRDYPTNADANIANLPVERMLAIAKRADIPVRGSLSGTAHFSGTAKNPEGNVDLELARAVVYDEPIDRMRTRVVYLAQSVDVPQLEIVAGGSRIELTAKYDHPAGNLQQGTAQFSVNSSRIDLTRIRNVQRMRAGLGGTLQLTANGAGAVREGSPRILFSRLNANVAANGIAIQGKNFGNLTLTANTAAGDRLNFALESNLADAAIRGSGNAQLNGDYPIDAQVTFNNVLYTHVRELLGPVGGKESDFEGATDGQITMSGPATKTDQLRGSLRLTKLNLTTTPSVGKPIAITNQGPLAVTLENGAVRIQNAHLTGPQTDIEIGGTASLQGPLNMTLNASADLGVLPSFDQEIYSSGKVLLGTTVRGTMSKPLVNGQLTLEDASLNYSGMTNGISKANGVVAFNGNNATIRNLTAESGGGKITLGGFVGFTDVVRLGVRATVSNVRMRVQEGVSVVAGAELRLTGTTNASTVSGTVTVNQVTWNPQSDIGSLLTRAAPPVQSPSTPSPLLDNMKLDVRVQTAGLAVQAALAQNLRADADLRVRGTAAEPGVSGRVTINEGQLVFFGATYTVNNGAISFFNPIRIEPILDINLETQAKGVAVNLRVTGPIDNMNLSYTSNPPLQFQEIVQLLASGKTPTSDPTLLASQPQQPAQSFQQMGESAIVGKALADPVSSRLQRVFGVSQFKIDPSFAAGSGTPTARLTLQQQVTSNLTFTYTSALDDPNGQIIKIEWAFNPQWAAVANRDQNGIFSINFFYKRQFR